MDSPAQMGDRVGGMKKYWLNVKVVVLRMIVIVERAAHMFALDTCNFHIA